MRHFGMARQNMRFLRKIYFAKQISLEFTYFSTFFSANSGTKANQFSWPGLLTGDCDSKFDISGKRLVVFVTFCFMVAVAYDFGCDRRCVFKSERKKQRCFVRLMHKIENH